MLNHGLFRYSFHTRSAIPYCCIFCVPMHLAHEMPRDGRHVQLDSNNRRLDEANALLSYKRYTVQREHC